MVLLDTQFCSEIVNQSDYSSQNRLLAVPPMFQALPLRPGIVDTNGKHSKLKQAIEHKENQ